LMQGAYSFIVQGDRINPVTVNPVTVRTTS
jgi:hypothetical protein